MRYFTERLNQRMPLLEVSGSEVVYAGNPELGDAVRKVLKEYRQKFQIGLGAFPYYDMFAEEVKAREKASCVIDDGRRVFDPKNHANWMVYTEGDIVCAHLKNLNGTRYRLDDFVNLLRSNSKPIEVGEDFSDKRAEEAVGTAATAANAGFNNTKKQKRGNKMHEELKQFIESIGINADEITQHPGKIYGNNETGFLTYVQVTNEYGLHARPATLFVKNAVKCSGDITIYCDMNKASAKSIMGIMTLDAPRGSGIFIFAKPEEGCQEQDERKCLEDMVSLVRNGFGEN